MGPDRPSGEGTEPGVVRHRPIPDGPQGSGYTTSGDRAGTVGQDCWVKGDLLLDQLGVEAEWVEVDTGHRLMRSLASACDPDTWTQALAPATAYRSVEEVGRTSVDDVPTTHYGVELDAQVAGELGGQPDLAETLGDAVPVDLYVDDQGRVVRMEMELEIEGQDVAMRTDFRDYGGEVDIRRPDPTQVGRVTR